MDLILCHLAADFDSLGAAVGGARLYPGARIVITGGVLPDVQEFLALHRDEYPLLELRAVHPEQIRRLILVDCHDPDRLGKASSWLALPQVDIHIYDHHVDSSIPPVSSDLDRFRSRITWQQIEPVGSTCTLMVEQLQARSISLTPFETTILALGIHVDTGSLTFASTTARDAGALAWLMQQGLNMQLLSKYVGLGLPPLLQDLLSRALTDLQSEGVAGYQLASLVLDLPEYVPGLAGLVMRLMELTNIDVLILVARQGERISLIGRSGYEFAQLHKIMQGYGGGGHARAAAASLKRSSSPPPADLAHDLLHQVRIRIPQPLTAAELMSSPVRTVRPDTTIHEAQRVLLRYGHSGLLVVDEQDHLVGVMSRRDMDLALHHGFGHAPVKGYMTSAVRTITPATPLSEIQTLMVKWDIGRLPVVEQGCILGIVTRTDVLRHLHQLPDPVRIPFPLTVSLSPEGAARLGLLSVEQQQLLWEAATVADQMGIHLYLVGGAVRDLLLGRATDDLDLVADGPHPLGQINPEGWGLQLGRVLHQRDPQTRLEVHGKYQTVTLEWPNGLWIDIATARTEFYPYPAAPPQVAAGSIQQDLYRRDFTINALALRLNGPTAGQVLDFFGGQEDLAQRRIRVLHPNSFIEDPTRIFRAVRFAVKLDFQVDDQTLTYLHGAIASGVHDAVGGDRLKNELRFILTAPGWAKALAQLAQWKALRCIHPDLIWTAQLRQRIRRISAWTAHFAPLYPELNRHDLWQLRLEVMLATLSQSAEVATKLHLSQEGIDRLQDFLKWVDPVLTVLTQPCLPSRIHHHLQRRSVQEIMLLAVVYPSTRRPLRRYLTLWRRQKPLLNGEHLKQMGYPPGRYYQTILNQLLQATLDGEVQTEQEAKALIQSRFPLLAKEK